MSNYTFGKNCQIPNLNEILLKHIGYKTDGVFVEGGAFDCYMWSNTYGLAKIGWKGLYFEPQLAEYLKCVNRHKSNSNIEVVRKALSDWRGDTDLFLGGSLSTISERARAAYLETEWGKSTGLASGKREQVAVSTLSRELAARSWPSQYDVFVLDVEGSEPRALRGYNINRWRPRLAIIETHDMYESASLSKKSVWIDVYFEMHGYEKIQSDTINSIYVDRSSECLQIH